MFWATEMWQDLHLSKMFLTEIGKTSVSNLSFHKTENWNIKDDASVLSSCVLCLPSSRAHIWVHIRASRAPPKCPHFQSTPQVPDGAPASPKDILGGVVGSQLCHGRPTSLLLHGSRNGHRPGGLLSCLGVPWGLQCAHPPSPLDVAWRGMHLWGGGINISPVSLCLGFPFLLCPYLGFPVIIISLLVLSRVSLIIKSLHCVLVLCFPVSRVQSQMSYRVPMFCCFWISVKDCVFGISWVSSFPRTVFHVLEMVTRCLAETMVLSYL